MGWGLLVPLQEAVDKWGQFPGLAALPPIHLPVLRLRKGGGEDRAGSCLIWRLFSWMGEVDSWLRPSSFLTAGAGAGAASMSVGVEAQLLAAVPL